MYMYGYYRLLLLLFFQAEDGKRVAHWLLDFRRVLFLADQAARQPASRSRSVILLQPGRTPTASRRRSSRRARRARSRAGSSHRECIRRDRSRLSDRKSVVTGKSGSVRVDLGGRRIIKKNIASMINIMMKGREQKKVNEQA